MDKKGAIQVLKEGYQNAGLELIEESESELKFKYHESHFYLTEKDIQEYANFYDSFSDLKITPVNCSICSNNYREHVLILPSYLRRVMFFPSRSKSYFFGNPEGEEVYSEIGYATPLFKNFFRFDNDYLALCLSRMRIPYLEHNNKDKPEIRDYLYKPITIKIYNLNESNIEATIKRTTPLIEACLFELSYMKSITYFLSEGWDSSHTKISPFTYGEQCGDNSLPLPRSNFRSDPIKFYQRGMSTEDPINQYLAFYQVLEYFFIEVSDEQLYNKISRRINDPKCSTTPKNLDRIIQDVIDFNRITNETEMLKTVLDKFVEEGEIIDFIKSYEDYLKKKIYTKKRNIFGEDLQISISKGYVISSTAKLIKTIRNALVHSSDRYERVDRYIPGTSSENMIKLEIPLIKYLSERIIIGSSK